MGVNGVKAAKGSATGDEEKKRGNSTKLQDEVDVQRQVSRGK